MEAKFILSKSKVLEQYEDLKSLGLKVSYSYKTNRGVGDVLQDSDCEFSIHNIGEIELIKDKNKIWYFTQAESESDLRRILDQGVRSFVADNEIDFRRLMKVLEETGIKINLSLRMKFQEHRVGTGRYFVYGMPSRKVNELIAEIRDNPLIDKLGVHVHRKSQNTTEWQIVDEIRDSLSEESLKRINVVNLGGGLPVKYKTYSTEVMPYIFEKIREVKEWLSDRNIATYIETGRFIAAPAIKLEAEIIQVYDNNIVLNCSIYNSALDTMVTNIRMIVDGELADREKGEYYLIKGNTPTRDDIFRYKVRLSQPKVGDKITFLNAGAYNYTTDFCCLEKLKTEITL